MRHIDRSDLLEWGHSAPRAGCGRSTCDGVKESKLVGTEGRRGICEKETGWEEGTKDKNEPFRVCCCFEHQRVCRDQTFETT